MPHRVAIVSTEQGRGTGAYIVLEHLLTGWCEAPRGVELLVIAPPASAVATHAGRLGLARLPLAAEHDRAIENIRIAFSSSPELRACAAVHAWHSRGFEIALALGTRLHIPATATLHDHPTCSTHGWLRRQLITSSARRLSRIACVSHAVRDAWVPLCGPERLRVIHNGLVEDVRPARHDGDALQIGFLGMYSQWKGFGIVRSWIDAMREAPVCWRLYGDPADCWQSDAQTLAERLPGTVTLCGTQPPSTIWREIDVLVHASTEFDPFPTVLLEAARAGVPAIASSLGGSDEIVKHGETGFIFNPAEPETGLQHLRMLVGTAAGRAQMGQAARKRFETVFFVEHMAAGYAAFWEEMAAGATVKTTPQDKR